MHTILNEISLKLPNFLKGRKEKRGIITSLIAGFIGLAYKGISSYLHNRQQKAMHQAFIPMEKKVDLQCHKVVPLKNPVVMYGIYNSKILEKLIILYIKCTIILLGMKNYFPENLMSGIIGICLKTVLTIMP